MKNYFLKLFEHEHWANLHVLEMYFRSADPPPRAIELLCHIVAAQRIWLDWINGNEMMVTPFEVFDEEALLELLEINYNELKRLIECSDFEQLFTVNSVDNKQSTKNIGDTLTHLALHASYHRGQLVMLLKSEDNLPPKTDFIHYAN